jgi:hypothetical protein
MSPAVPVHPVERKIDAIPRESFRIPNVGPFDCFAAVNKLPISSGITGKSELSPGSNVLVVEKFHLAKHREEYLESFEAGPERPKKEEFFSDPKFTVGDDREIDVA